MNKDEKNKNKKQPDLESEKLADDRSYKLQEEDDFSNLDEESRELLEDAREDEYEEELARYTDDLEIQESFIERQQLDTGRRELEEKLKEHHSTSPTLSGGDIDAAWDDADVGEETVGGSTPTPDQDEVDEIGEALGITYEDDEPLHTGEKLSKRDEHRWELDPDSAEEDEDLD